MNRTLYRLVYWLGHTGWDTNPPPELIEALSADDLPGGAAVDLGCGTGGNVLYMARQGRPAIGLDFVPEAIAQARAKAQAAGLNGLAQFHVADVTRLASLGLPPCAVALDMGCFHGLNPAGQRRYAQGLADVLVPGGLFLLYTLDPRREAGVSFGLTPDQVRPAFASWFRVEREARGGAWGDESTWFWLRRKPGHLPNLA